MTTKELFQRIASVEFQADVVAPTPSVLRHLLRRRWEVRDLQIAYDSGCLLDEQLRTFVNGLLRESAACDRFPYQIALAAIAVMLESRFSLFAEEYLNDLSRIRSDRFSVAARVARECLAARKQATGTDVRRFPPQGPIRGTCHWTVPGDSGNGEYEADVINEFESFEVA